MTNRPCHPERSRRLSPPGLAVLAGVALVAGLLAGCGRQDSGSGGNAGDRQGAGPRTVVVSGTPDKARFAVAWSTDSASGKAGRDATHAALRAVGGRAKAVVFVTYYEEPEFAPPRDKRARACKPDHSAEDLVARAVAEECGPVPNIGCRARPLTNHGTMLRNAVAVLAVAGDQVQVATARAAITPDRLATGRALAKGLQGAPGAAMILVLGEMKLSFETDPKVRVEDFLRGLLTGARSDVVLWGGNAMPEDAEDPHARAGKQFFNGRPLTGHVVALALAGPVAAFANQGHEFEPTVQSTKVTKTRGKWVIELDGKPAETVYRQLVGLGSDAKLTSDWRHAMGVDLGGGRSYVRMILNWVRGGKDKDGLPVDLPDGSLLFAGALPRDTRLVGLISGSSPARIITSARQTVGEALARARDEDAEPALCLIADCCTRGMRLRMSDSEDRDEILDGVVPALGHRYDVPIFGFYAWGELGRVRGPLLDLKHRHQQHAFVTALVGYLK